MFEDVVSSFQNENDHSQREVDMLTDKLKIAYIYWKKI